MIGLRYHPLRERLPIDMVNNGDNSLVGADPNGINNSCIYEPDYSGDSPHLNHNPRTNGNNYFDT
jgi:hypothetical protein